MTTRANNKTQRSQITSSPISFNTPQEPPVVIGVITQPHGIRGELKIHLFNPESDTLSCVQQLLLRRPAQSHGDSYGDSYEIEGVRNQNQTLLLRLKECKDRNHAEGLRGAEILVYPEDLPELPDDEFYLYELQGLPVFHAVTGTPMGEILDVLPSPAQFLLVIGYQGREVLVPLVEEWVPVIDLDNKRVEITPIPGLFDDHSV